MRPRDTASRELAWTGRLRPGEPRILTWVMSLPADVAVGARLACRVVVHGRAVPQLGLARAVRVQATDFSGSGKWVVDRPVAWAGDTVAFRLRIANAGRGAADVRLSDPLPPGLHYVPGSASASHGLPPTWEAAVGALTWAGTLPGETAVDLAFSARFDGDRRVTNAMWLSDDAGTHFAAWAEVVPATARLFLPRVSTAPP